MQRFLLLMLALLILTGCNRQALQPAQATAEAAIDRIVPTAGAALEQLAPTVRALVPTPAPAPSAWNNTGCVKSKNENSLLSILYLRTANLYTYVA